MTQHRPCRCRCPTPTARAPTRTVPVLVSTRTARALVPTRTAQVAIDLNKESIATWYKTEPDWNKKRVKYTLNCASTKDAQKYRLRYLVRL